TRRRSEATGELASFVEREACPARRHAVADLAVGDARASQRVAERGLGDRGLGDDQRVRLDSILLPGDGRLDDRLPSVPRGERDGRPCLNSGTGEPLAERARGSTVAEA